VDRILRRSSLIYTQSVYLIDMSDSEGFFDDTASWSFDEETLRLLDEPPDMQRPSDNAPVQGISTNVNWDDSYQQRLFGAAKAQAKLELYPWQLKVCDASHQGKDVFICAGTGYGKTAPCVMRCLVESELLIWLISPLNALGNQHASNFQKWGIKAISVNATTYYKGLYKVSYLYDSSIGHQKLY
jgi:ATP-dependent helicase YprA (DUF1998 family)